MSSKIQPASWAAAYEACLAQIQALLEEHSKAMAKDCDNSPVNRLKFTVKGELDLSAKAHHIELDLSYEPVVVKQKDTRSIQGEDPDQLRLSLSGAPGMPLEPETKKPKAEPAKVPPVPPPPVTPPPPPAAVDDDEDAWGSPPKVTQPTAVSEPEAPKGKKKKAK